MKIDAAEKYEHDRRSGAGLMLWIGFVLPPLAWAAGMEGLWLASEWACDRMDFKWNHIIAGIALMISIAGVFIAWTQGKASASTPDATTIETPQTREFMSILGTVLGIVFTVLIFAQWLPTLTGVPCSK